MKIYETLISGGPDIYYNPGFRSMIEDHLTIIRNQPDTQVVDIEPLVAYKYAGDFFGLMMSQNIAPQYHWIIMRVNDLISPQDYKDDQLTFIKPSYTFINRLTSVYQSQSKIRK